MPPFAAGSGLVMLNVSVAPEPELDRTPAPITAIEAPVAEPVLPVSVVIAGSEPPIPSKSRFLVNGL